MHPMASSSSNSRQVAQFASRTSGASRYAQIVIKEPNTSEPKKAKRKRITPEQLKELTAVFEKTDTPTHDIREELSKKLGMTNREVQVWFQNRRAKYNRMRIEQQRQLRTNAAILYSTRMMAGTSLPVRMQIPVPVALPMSAPVPISSHHQQQQHPAYSYPNVMSYQSACVMSDSGDVPHHMSSPSGPPLTPATGYPQYSHSQPSVDYMDTQTPSLGSASAMYGPLSPPLPKHTHASTGRSSPPALSPPMRAHAHGTSASAAARSRYLPAVPSYPYNRQYDRGCTSPSALELSHASACKDHDDGPLHSKQSGLECAPVRLPPISTMLAGTNEAQSGPPRSLSRLRAYTSPSPPSVGSAHNHPYVESAASVPAHTRSSMINPADQDCSGYSRSEAASDAQFRDAKMGIDSFRFKLTDHRMQSRKMTPVDTGRSAQSWRPW
ncbi:homeobox domain-containing protein [Coemansia mojavensis]|nr:homeobox domain-containing protein [Coemansia mojavensis]